MKKVIACFLAAVMLLGMTGCQQTEPETSAPELLEPVGIKKDQDVFKVERGEIAQMKLVGGEVVPYVERLSFSADGKVGTLNVTLGDKVKKGDLLASLTSTEDKEKISKLEAEIAHVKKLADFEDRQTQLEIDIKKIELAMMQAAGETAEACAVKQVEIEIAEAALRQNRELRALSIRRQEEDLAKLQTSAQAVEIVAPCNGRVVEIKSGLQVGKSVKADEVLICVTDESRVYIGVANWEEGSSLNGYTVSYCESLKKITAQIVRTKYELTFDASIQYEKVTENNPDPELMQPLFAVDAPAGSLVIGDYVAIRMYERVEENALRIPMDALYSDGVNSFVYKNENGKRVVCNVETRIRTDSYVEIIAGLKEGDEVFVKN